MEREVLPNDCFFMVMEKKIIAAKINRKVGEKLHMTLYLNDIDAWNGKAIVDHYTMNACDLFSPGDSGDYPPY